MNMEAGMSKRSALLQTSNSLTQGLSVILMNPLQSVVGIVNHQEDPAWPPPHSWPCLPARWSVTFPASEEEAGCLQKVLCSTWSSC